MSGIITATSYVWAALAGVCFVKGLAVLSSGRRK